MYSKLPTVPLLSLDSLRQNIRAYYLKPEAEVVRELIAEAAFSDRERTTISGKAAELVAQVRDSGKPSMMENFLAEYGLTTREGVALMCLAEALLRVPDAKTIDELIEDKISPGNWGKHLGHSGSPLVNASTWALLLTGKLIAAEDEAGLRQALRILVKRLGESLVRTAVAQALRELGRHFVLGTNIESASKRAKELERQGYTYSYDMLGEAARTEADARRYHLAYSDAITALARDCVHDDIRANPGISVKLSALHPRYEMAQHQRVIDELVPRATSLAMLARSANMGFNIDAEEADRLDISLEAIEAILSNPALRGWDGFGVVVQAFGKRAGPTLDWLYALAIRLDCRLMVRLVKGAYWDSEIKRAQVLGLDGYPVYTRKVNTDLAYLAGARKLLGMRDRVYAQFATHNAHSVAAVLELAGSSDRFEFQRLHGMGEALHDRVLRQHRSRCRIYAPVGEHQDLLAYLVRRLLENGANSSFVNQIVDTSMTPESIARDPIDVINELDQAANPLIPPPTDLYGPTRRNAKGWDITDASTLVDLDHQRRDMGVKVWCAQPITLSAAETAVSRQVNNPANPGEVVGTVTDCDEKVVDGAIAAAVDAFDSWRGTPVTERAASLRRVADLYEARAPELFALLAREAGKTWLDAVGEVREAVDFGRYYASQAEAMSEARMPRGVFVCISPWNFPLAIFSGQIFAALVSGNCVLAKPAEQTSLIAALAVELMHQAGIPRAVLQLLPGDGATVGASLTRDARISGVCFTGSTETALAINRNMAQFLPADAPLIAETGGLNAMIVDSSALPEQVVRDVLISAFQSAGQRCSALRMLYLQRDVADKILTMLFGAMDELRLGDPWLLSTDVGPVIDLEAEQKIDTHCRQMAAQNRVLKWLTPPEAGLYVGPCVIELDGIEQLDTEIFGPVLHVARYDVADLDTVVDAINAKGFGLTFGLHTRVDTRVEQVVRKVRVGNVYINRNQIGAVVGSQPFGGEGLSGTGPKAGGPAYLLRFTQMTKVAVDPVELPNLEFEAMAQCLADIAGRRLEPPDLERLARLAAEQGLENDVVSTVGVVQLPGPTGESNRLCGYPRGLVLCLGPTRKAALRQALGALVQHNKVLILAHQGDELGRLLRDQGFTVDGRAAYPSLSALQSLDGFDAVMSAADDGALRKLRLALAARVGAIVPLITEADGPERLIVERHLCIDTTAAGGNASLIAAS